MAMAKNLVNDSVWGVSKYNFSSSSSSILWVLILSLLYYIAGISIYLPFILNVIFSFIILLIISLYFKKLCISEYLLFFLLAAVIFITPFITVIFIGMEHGLHILLSVLFIFLSIEYIIDPERNQKNQKYLIMLSFLLVSVRYESVFLIFAAGILLILKGRFKTAFLIFISAALPVIIYGIISISEGWYFIPNSILLKGRKISSAGDIFKLVNFIPTLTKIYYYSDVLIMFSIAVCMIILQFNKVWRISLRCRYFLIIFVITVFLHAHFADFGWYYRYEAYLITIGLITLCLCGYEYFMNFFIYEKEKRNLLLKYLFLILIIVFFLMEYRYRSFDAITSLPNVSRNLYEQHYQVGTFLNKYYSGQAAAINDIGLPNYLADIKCLDLWGLGSIEPAKLKRENNYNAKTLNKWIFSKDVKIAAVYKSWFKYGQIISDGIPENWFWAGDWIIDDAIVINSNKVSFYAFSRNGRDRLITQLKEFESVMPGGIYVLGFNGDTDTTETLYYKIGYSSDAVNLSENYK